MAISTYAELQTAIANWLARDDLTVYIPDFIALFEAKAARVLRVRPMEVTETIEPDDGEAPLPSDYLGHRRLTWMGDTRVELAHAAPAWLHAAYPTTAEGTPAFYTIEGGNVIIRPVSDTDLELVYYAKNTALDDAHGFQVDESRLAMWAQRRDEVFKEIKDLNFGEPSSMSVRYFGSTP
jgi:hypothetical protein